MSKLLCVFHGGCDDGFAAAWVVRKALGEDNVEFFSGSYAFPPPDVAGRDVIMVDFSYKCHVLKKMIEPCRSMLILDHHVTAQEDLAFLPDTWKTWADHFEAPTHKAHAKFDMERSGAGMAWDFFFPDRCRYVYPNEEETFINYIEDRDLWRRKMRHGDEFTIALRSYPQDFKVWDGLIKRGVAALIEEGVSLQRYYRLRVEELKRHAYLAQLGGERCWIANAPHAFASEVAGELATDDEFGACYFEVAPGKWQYSLRSRNRIDVSEIAKRYGGGGHKKAAGFNIGGIGGETGDHIPVHPQPPRP